MAAISDNNDSVSEGYHGVYYSHEFNIITLAPASRGVADSFDYSSDVATYPNLFMSCCDKLMGNLGTLSNG